MLTPLVRACVLLLAGWLALGIAHISLLPPWEGFDETAHYSYLQQLVHTGRVPRRSHAFLSRDVEQYAASAPIAYDTVPLHTTYESFFRSDPGAIERARRLVHEPPAAARRYEASRLWNWQSQHPPLYYLTLVPVYLATADASWSRHLWWLRLTSYAMAWAALALAALTCAVAASKGGDGAARWRWGLLGVSVWPAFFPGWFPEMARVGNDALLALVVGLVWLTVVRRRAPADDGPSVVLLGLLLGAGCLTKAFFPPIAAVVAGYLYARERATPSGSRPLARTVALLAVTAGGALWWYLDSWPRYANLLTGRQAGGLIEGLEKNFSPWALGRVHAAMLASFTWPGSWSLARPPYVFYVPLVLLLVLVAGAYLARLRRRGRLDPEWLSLYLVLPLLAMLSYVAVVQIARTGTGRVPGGYYVHFLAAPLGYGLGQALSTLWSRPPARRALAVLIIYALGFSVAMWWAQLLLFAGILTKSPERFYDLAVPLPRLLSIPEALDRLAVLAYPRLALASWVAGLALVSAGLFGAWRAVATPSDATGRVFLLGTKSARL